MLRILALRCNRTRQRLQHDLASTYVQEMDWVDLIPAPDLKLLLVLLLILFSCFYFAVSLK